MANWGDFHNVTGAGWSAFWRISKADGSGLELWWADFKGKRVLWRGTQPLAIVPYHHPVAFPTKGDSTFKDGLNPQSDGASFLALKFQAPDSNLGHTSPWNAAKDTEAVFVEVEPASPFKPETLAISAKFQCGWYQYLHRWEFSSDGVIEPNIAMGGALNPYAPDASHVHHMYFRIDLDIDGFQSDLFEVFEHQSFQHPAGDVWTTQANQGKFLADPKSSRKFRVRDLVSASSPGTPRGYEIEVPQSAGVDKHGTGDVWATIYRGDSLQQGEDVGSDPLCTDAAVTAYATGPLNTVSGSDVVLWVVIRHHHEPRERAEEKVYLPYHYAHFSIVPRGFEIFREPPAGGHDG